MPTRKSKKDSQIIVNRKVLGKKRTPNLKIRVGKDLFSNLNAPDLLDFVATRLAHHHRDSIKAGKLPSGRPVPKLTDRYRTIPRRGGFFERSGESIDKFTIDPIKGHSLNAKTKLYPYSEPHYAWIYESMSKNGIDMTSVDGAARAVIEKAVADWTRKYGVTEHEHAPKINRTRRYVQNIKRR